MSDLVPNVNAPTRFTFHNCLGEGGFGEVYRASAWRGGTQETVAVKVLHVERQRQRAAVDRLRDEARMLAVLDHPAILRFQQFTRIEGRLALVTEYVEGSDISAFGEDGPTMPPKAALEVIAQVASALTSALLTPSPETGNALGLVHRDIKPHNIRISTAGEVKLLDFGIARTTELSREAQTWIGEVLCTPGYASPELLCGDPSGHASDIYALGVTLYGLLAHTHFHIAHTIPKQRKVALLRNRYSAFFEGRLELLPEDLPDELVDLLRRMLAYDYVERPEGSEVEAVLSGLAADMEGHGLTRLSRRLPVPEAHDGELCGLTVEETPISIEPTAIPVAERRAPPKAPTEAGPAYSAPAPSSVVGPQSLETPPAPAPRGMRLELVGTAIGLVLVGIAWLVFG